MCRLFVLRHSGADGEWCLDRAALTRARIVVSIPVPGVCLVVVVPVVAYDSMTSVAITPAVRGFVLVVAVAWQLAACRCSSDRCLPCCMLLLMSTACGCAHVVSHNRRGHVVVVAAVVVAAVVFVEVVVIVIVSVVIVVVSVCRMSPTKLSSWLSPSLWSSSALSCRSSLCGRRWLCCRSSTCCGSGGGGGGGSTSTHSSGTGNSSNSSSSSRSCSYCC